MKSQNYSELYTQGSCSISGRIYQDTDSSGFYAEGDLELGGITVYYSNGQIARSVVSHSDGCYLIPNLPEGTWFLSLPQLTDGFAFSYAHVDNQMLTFDGRVKIELRDDKPNATNINFGYKGRCQLSGQVIAKNKSKVLDIGQMSLIIAPIDKSFAARKVTTDRAGYYKIDNLLPYEYQVFLGEGHPLLMLDDLVEIEVVNLSSNIDLKTVIDFSAAVNIHSAVESSR